MPKHRLVTIGDSITQGVRSGAAVDGSLAWPSFLAEAMGIADTFRCPTIADPDLGLPINLEALIGHLSKHYGKKLSWYEVAAAGLRVRAWMDDLEDHWEEDDAGTPPQGDDSGPNHNLGILGFDLRDALSMTAAECDRRIPGSRENDALVNQIPEHAGLRVARRVLRSAGPSATVFDAAKAIADDGGLEVLVVMLGANNALQVASDLELHWSGPGFDDLDQKRGYTLWQPAHFVSEYERVADAAERVGAETTVLCTVPNVTIIPLARGVEKKMAVGSRYYEHYTRIWIDDDDFDPDRDKHITHRDARDADLAIAEYNEFIRAEADRRGWGVFPLGELLDSMATKRYIDDHDARPAGFVPYDWPAPLDDLDPELGTKFLKSKKGKRKAGGIFSLDGIHPTVIGSALIAHEMAKLLTSLGVGDIGEVDLADALARDRLNTNPPDPRLGARRDRLARSARRRVQLDRSPVRLTSESSQLVDSATRSSEVVGATGDSFWRSRHSRTLSTTTNPNAIHVTNTFVPLWAPALMSPS